MRIQLGSAPYIFYTTFSHTNSITSISIPFIHPIHLISSNPSTIPSIHQGKFIKEWRLKHVEGREGLLWKGSQLTFNLWISSLFGSIGACHGLYKICIVASPHVRLAIWLVKDYVDFVHHMFDEMIIMNIFYHECLFSFYVWFVWLNSLFIVLGWPFQYYA